MQSLSRSYGTRAHRRSGPGGPHVALGQGLGTRVAASTAPARRDDSLHRATQLLADTAHDLRGSLTAAREMVRLVSDGIEGPVTAAQKESLASVIERCNEMDRLVANMLDGERLQTQAPRTVRGPIDIDRLGRSLLANLRPMARERCVRVDYGHRRLGNQRPFGDADQVQRLLTNLAQNAIRASTAGNLVTISGVPAAGGRKVRFTVADRSGSLTAERVEALAQRGATGGGSYGLGLGIATQMAALQFGFVEIATIPDRSTQASVELPVSSAEPVVSTFLEWRRAWLNGLPKPTTQVRILPPRISRPRNPGQLLVLSLRASCPPQLTERVDSLIQAACGYHELVYRRSEFDWVVLWDDTIEAAGRRMEDLRSRATSLVYGATATAPKPVLRCQRRTVHCIDSQEQRFQMIDLFLRSVCQHDGRKSPPATAAPPMPAANVRLETRLDEELRRLAAHLRREGRALRKAAQDARR